MARGNWKSTRPKIVIALKSLPKDFWVTKTYIKKSTNCFWGAVLRTFKELENEGLIDTINTSCGVLHKWKWKSDTDSPPEV